MAPIVEIGSGAVPEILQGLVHSRGLAALDLTDLLGTLGGSRSADGSEAALTCLLLHLGRLDLALSLNFLVVTKEVVEFVTLRGDLSCRSAGRHRDFLIVVERDVRRRTRSARHHGSDGSCGSGSRLEESGEIITGGNALMTHLLLE